MIYKIVRASVILSWLDLAKTKNQWKFYGTLYNMNMSMLLQPTNLLALQLRAASTFKDD